MVQKREYDTLVSKLKSKIFQIEYCLYQAISPSTVPRNPATIVFILERGEIFNKSLTKKANLKILKY